MIISYVFLVTQFVCVIYGDICLERYTFVFVKKNFMFVYIY